MTDSVSVVSMSVDADDVAPDGSEVRLRVRGETASMANFQLNAGAASRAVAHRSVEELWFVLAGNGHIWLKSETAEETVALRPGVSVRIPKGTVFQFRASHEDMLSILGVTIPPWPIDPVGAEPADVQAWQPTV
jgi:mannose-6-phosphate isomerase-like protein (cupin superfamily)